jgi:hypothetical protein
MTAVIIAALLSAPQPITTDAPALIMPAPEWSFAAMPIPDEPYDMNAGAFADFVEAEREAAIMVSVTPFASPFAPSEYVDPFADDRNPEPDFEAEPRLVWWTPNATRTEKW